MRPARVKIKSVSLTWCGVLEFLLDHVDQIADLLWWSSPEYKAVSQVNKTEITSGTVELDQMFI